MCLGYRCQESGKRHIIRWRQRTDARFTSTSFLATRNLTTSKCPSLAAYHSAEWPCHSAEPPSLRLIFTSSTSDCTVLRSPFLAAEINFDSLIFEMNNYQIKTITSRVVRSIVMSLCLLIRLSVGHINFIR